MQKNFPHVIQKPHVDDAAYIQYMYVLNSLRSRDIWRKHVMETFQMGKYFIC